MTTFLGLDDFRKARAHIAPHVHRTPVLTSETLGGIVGAKVFLKAECFQKAGSYKVRGPLNVLARMSDAERRKGLITASAGNHAQGVARAARVYGIPASVVMSKAAKEAKIQATRAYGAEVIIHGDVWDDAYQRSLELMRDRGMTYIHPFDDPVLIAGQGGVGLEFIEDVPDLDVVLIPIGGGGLISGCAMAMKSVNPKLWVIGVEAAGAPGMARSVQAGRVVTLDSVGPMIDGLVVRRVGEYTLEVVKQYVDEILLVDEQRIFDAIPWVMERLKLVVEGAAAAPIAALLNGQLRTKSDAKIGCVISGGNLDVASLRGKSWN
jgi:threonine dehydratase